jgi:REP element-mobilizing transposase RayT
MPDNPRGFVQEGEGIQPPNPELAGAYRDAASDQPYLMDQAAQRFVIDVVRDIGARRDWRIHAVACEPSHIHILVSWESDTTWSVLRAKFKNIIALELSKHYNQMGRHWVSDGGSRKQVKDRRHFDYLMTTYLPKHGGEQWYEGMQA